MSVHRGGGSTWPGTPPQVAYPLGADNPPTGYTLLGPAAPPLGADTPLWTGTPPRASENTQDKVHPPRTRFTPMTRYTPRDQIHPLGPGSPLKTRYTPRTRYNLPGGVCSWGVCLLQGWVWSWGCDSFRGVCLLPGGVLSQHALRQTPLTACGQTDACKNMTFTNSLWTVIIIYNLLSPFTTCIKTHPSPCKQTLVSCPNFDEETFLVLLIFSQTPGKITVDPLQHWGVGGNVQARMRTPLLIPLRSVVPLYRHTWEHDWIPCGALPPPH